MPKQDIVWPYKSWYRYFGPKVDTLFGHMDPATLNPKPLWDPLGYLMLKAFRGEGIGWVLV